MKLVNLFTLFAVIFISCGKEDDQINAYAKQVEGTYKGTLRSDPGAPEVEITAKAGPDNNIILSFEHNVETGKVELVCSDISFEDFSYDDYVLFNIGDQKSGAKAQYSYSGRRIRYDVNMPPHQGYFTLKPDGKMELRLMAEVVTNDNHTYTMIMEAYK